MDCRTIDLQDLAYGFDDRARGHVAQCDRCRADLARLEDEKSLLAQAVAAAAPAERVERRVAALVPLGFAAALIVGLVAMLWPKPETTAPLRETTVEDLDRAIAADPRNARLFLERAVLHARVGRFDLADRDLQWGAQLDPLAERAIGAARRAIHLEQLKRRLKDLTGPEAERVRNEIERLKREP